MKLLRLQGRKGSDYVLRKGRKWNGKTFTAYWLPGPQRRKGEKEGNPGLYVGTFASTRLHKTAVARNRMRRRVREALRLYVQEKTEIPSAQLLLTPRSASLNAPFEDIQKEVSIFLSQLPTWQPKKQN